MNTKLFAVFLTLAVMVTIASCSSGYSGGRVYGTVEQYADGVAVAGGYRGSDGRAYHGAYREGQGISGYRRGPSYGGYNYNYGGGYY